MARGVGPGPIQTLTRLCTIRSYFILCILRKFEWCSAMLMSMVHAAMFKAIMGQRHHANNHWNGQRRMVMTFLIQLPKVSGESNSTIIDTWFRSIHLLAIWISYARTFTRPQIKTGRTPFILKFPWISKFLTWRGKQYDKESADYCKKCPHHSCDKIAELAANTSVKLDPRTTTQAKTANQTPLDPL